jgi:hypothetical protein
MIARREGDGHYGVHGSGCLGAGVLRVTCLVDSSINIGKTELRLYIPVKRATLHQKMLPEARRHHIYNRSNSAVGFTYLGRYGLLQLDSKSFHVGPKSRCQEHIEKAVNPDRPSPERSH